MGDISKNISRSEIACKCGCGFDTIDAVTARAVQDACDHFAEQLDVPRVVLDISSGARCEERNRSEGGSYRSQHLLGRAIDFKIRCVSPIEVQAYLLAKYPDRFGIGTYSNFTHFDSRNERARF